MSHREAHGLIVLIMLVGLVSAPVREVAAQTSRPDEGRGEAPTGLLAGPKVQESALGGAPGPRRQTDRSSGVSPLRWYELVRRLDLTEEQTEDFSVVWSEFRKAQRGFERDHGSEIRQLRKKLRQAERRSEQSNEYQAKLRGMRRLVPQAQPYQKRIWNDLTAEQQDELREALAQARESMRQRDLDRRQERDRRQDRDTSMDGRAPSSGADAPAKDGALDDPARKRVRFLRLRQTSGS